MLLQREKRWKEATELCLQVMETRKKVLGEEHLDTIFSMARLGEIYTDQVRWEEAERIQLNLLVRCRRAFGEQHFATRYSITYLAITWKALGRDKEAIQLMERCVPLSTERYGAGKPATRRYTSWRAWRLLSVPRIVGISGPSEAVSRPSLPEDQEE